MSWQSLTRSQERLCKWKGPDEVVLVSEECGLVKVSRESLGDAISAAMRDLMRVSGLDPIKDDLGDLRVSVGVGCVRLHAKTGAGKEWVGCAAIAVIETA